VLTIVVATFKIFEGGDLNHFTIVTVVKNDLLGLKQSRASLEMQNYKKWTHLIVDGASTDGTLDYLKELPQKNTSYISEADNGIYDAMNKAWQLADDNSFVFYLNARDKMTDQNSLSYANEALKDSPGSNWGCATHEESYQDGSGWVCKLVSPPSVQNQLYAFGYRSHQAVVMRRSFIKQLGGFDQKLKIAADWDLIVKAMLAEAPATWIHPIAKFELGGMSAGRMQEAHSELRELRFKYLKMSPKNRVLDFIWCTIYLDYFSYRNYLTIIIKVFRISIYFLNYSKIKLKRGAVLFYGLLRYVRLQKPTRIETDRIGFHHSKFELILIKTIKTLNSSLGILPYARPK
jgi:glycosyltransferase involved in cell wall biosynthesis